MISRQLRVCLSGIAIAALLPGRASGAATNSPAGGPWWSAAATAPAVALAAAFGPNAGAAWSISGGAAEKDGGPFSIIQDDRLGRPVLACGRLGVTLDGRTIYGNVEISCRVRLATVPEKTSSSFSLAFAKDPTNAAAAGLSATIQGEYNGDLNLTALGRMTRYDLRAYDTIMPTWADAVRIPIEQDMASLPLAQDKWVALRCQTGPGWVRVWVDDRLVATRVGTNAMSRAGLISIRMAPGCRIADFRVRALSADELRPDGTYEAVALDGYVRARALAGDAAVASDALPYGREVTVAGVPFRFPTRDGSRDAPDHLDLSRSLFRQGTMEGYLPTYPYRFASSFIVDPARITVRIPNGRYDALHVIAGFDGGRDRIATMSATFFRPDGGFAQFFETDVPGLSERPRVGAVPLPVRLENGRAVNLWLVTIPLDPARLASFSDLDFIELELTKQMKLFRSYPDPISYGWHPGGLPSGVHVYALTLHRPDVELAVAPKRFGDVWTDPEVPTYVVTLSNRTAKARPVEFAVSTASHDGLATSRVVRTLSLAPGQLVRTEIPCPVKKNGIHELGVTLKDGSPAWTETRYFARLAPDTRAESWTEGQGPMFWYWTYGGGHYTPPGEEIKRVMAMAGARAAGPTANAWPITPQWSWAGEEPIDPARYAAYRTNAVALIRAKQGDHPPFVTFFPEPHISRDLTAGNPPDYWGDPPYAPNAEEQKAFRVHFNTAKAAAEGVREAWPQTRILIPWGDPLYVLPLLRAGFPKSLVDGSGLDMIGFERLPEQQIAQQSMHRLYFLREEFRKAGITNPLLWYVEGTFVPTEPGACTWGEQAERYHRGTLLSLAYGCDRFYSGWFAYDCGNYYGAEHYGGCGIQRRIPYSDPKPAYAHFATMTRMLERTRFDQWLPTGSHSVYALKFDRLAGGSVYALWTIRGTRPVQLALATNGTITVTDSMDNGTTVKATNTLAALTISPSPVYVTGATVTNITLGIPNHSGSMQEARSRERETWHTGPGSQQPPPVARDIRLASLGDGTWTLTGERDTDYEGNNYDVRRYPGRMTARTQIRPSDYPEIAQRMEGCLAIHLEPQQERERQFMPWYSTLKPRRPLEIPGQASALGLWVRAASDWGRVVYCLRDARGERWLSVGTKDDWNCNDPHNWSVFNFDGWRYLRFELPAHSGYDLFRESGTTWWGHRGGDGVVDLPLSLDSIIVERRTHVMYVNDPQPADPEDVLLGDLIAEYATASDATPEAVRVSRTRMPLPQSGRLLANPIAKMAGTNALPAPAIDSVRQPDWGYDGTSCHVFFKDAPGAAQYQVWVAAYPDGRGAVVLGSMPASGGLVRGLRPARKLYLWLTYTEKPEAGKPLRQSKPSSPFEIDLVDAFGMK